MSKRIVWAGPWHAESPVALWGQKVVAELIARGNGVEILRTEGGTAANSRGLPCDLAVQHWSAVDIFQLARRFDVLIVNLTGSFNDSGALVENVQAAGAFGVFHDASLLQLFIDWACRSAFSSNELQARLRATYGTLTSRGRMTLPKSVRNQPDSRPLVEWFASGLCGALVHERSTLERVRDACAGPVELIPHGRNEPINTYAGALIQVVDVALQQRPTIMAGIALGRHLERIVGAGPLANTASQRIAASMRELFARDASVANG